MRRIREWGPLGRFRYLVTILAGNLKSHTGVRSLSLGQSLPPRLPSRSGGSKTACICFLSSFGCACLRARPREAGKAEVAGVGCSRGLGGFILFTIHNILC